MQRRKIDILFTSDVHLSHQRMIKARGFAHADEMNEAIIANWNAIVRPLDVIYILGDFSFAKIQHTKYLLSRLNGVKILILGNHDKAIRDAQDDFIGPNLFAEIHQVLSISAKRFRGMCGVMLDTPRIVMSHFSHRIWEDSHYGSWMLYGHSHGSAPTWGKSLDVGLDSKDITKELRPVTIDEVAAKMAKLQVRVIDHHQEREMKSTVEDKDETVHSENTQDQAGQA